MGIYCEHFHCVELIGNKSEITKYPTRWGAAKRCHELNRWSPLERWTVLPCGIQYVPDYNEFQTYQIRNLKLFDLKELYDN